MISFKELLGNSIEVAILFLWRILRADAQCLFNVRSGFYRVALRSYNSKHGHVGLATISVVNLIVCYLLFSAFTRSAELSAAPLFRDLQSLADDKDFLAYMLLAMTIYSLMAFCGIRLLLAGGRRFGLLRTHLNVSPFRFLCFVPHLFVSVALLAFMLGGIAIRLAVKAEPNSDLVGIASGILCFAYGFLIGPWQMLLLVRKRRGSGRRVARATIFVALSLITLASYFGAGIAVLYIQLSVSMQDNRRDLEKNRLSYGSIRCEAPSGDTRMVHVWIQNPSDTPRLISSISLPDDKKKMIKGQLAGGQPNEKIIIDARSTKIVSLLFSGLVECDTGAMQVHWL